MTRAKALRILSVTTGAAILLTLVGAFGTGDRPLPLRLAFWTVVMEVGALAGMGASAALQQWGRLASRPVAEWAVMSVLIAIPLTLVTMGAVAAFGMPLAGGGDAPSMFAAALAVSSAVTAVAYLATRSPAAADHGAGPKQAEGHDPSTTQPAPPRLLERLPAHARLTDVLALQSEDHYVRVHQAESSHLVLVRLADAISEMAPVPGARTHRSWWVARAAVRETRTADGRGELTLSSGLTVPVSRTELPSLRRLGWPGL